MHFSIGGGGLLSRFHILFPITYFSHVFSSDMLYLYIYPFVAQSLAIANTASLFALHPEAAYSVFE